MIEFDPGAQRMVLKLVYYGPALSGKTTNLLCLHDLLAKERRGDLMMLDTKDDRTIYFDLLPFFLVAPSGLKIKLKVYTVPGQIKHDATRKAVLQRADGVAFIADSQREERDNNSASFANLERNLALVGLDIEQTPLVIQFNKQDLAEIISWPELEAVWKPTGIPVFAASALQGWGIAETFRHLLTLTYARIDSRHGLWRDHGLDEESFVKQLTTTIAN